MSKVSSNDIECILVKDSKLGLEHQSNSPRVRLVNSWSLIILVSATTAALWLVAPSRNMLINLIARSSSPEISLAFLQALDNHERDQVDLNLMMAKNHLLLGQIEKASQILLELLQQGELTQKMNSKNQALYRLKLEVLQYQLYGENGEKKSRKLSEIRSFISKIHSVHDSNTARFFAEAAISVSMPDVAYRLLSPFAGDSGITDMELASLALQSSNFYGAYEHQLKLFYQYESVEELTKLFSIQVMSGRLIDRMTHFLEQYTGVLRENSKYVALSLNFLIKSGKQLQAELQSEKLIELTTDITVLSKISDTAISEGMLDIAEALLLAQIAINSNNAVLQKLHDIYRWQNDIPSALNISQKLAEQGGTRKQITQGIVEARAISDVYSEGGLYKKFVHRFDVDPSNYNHWISTIEKSFGTQSAVEQVNKMLTRKQNDWALVMHLARLQSYQGEYDKVIVSWPKFKQMKNPTVEQTMIYHEAYLQLQQYEQALSVLLSMPGWENQSETYLQDIFQLAWLLGRKELAKEVQKILQNLPEYNVSGDENIYRYVQLNQPFGDEDIDELLFFYRHWNHEKLLLIAFDLAKQNNNTKKMPLIVELANTDERLKDSERVLYYNMELAMQQGNASSVKKWFSTIIKKSPSSYSLINTYMWWLVNNEQLLFLEDTYSQYKLELQNNPHFWLIFSAASEKLGYLQDADYWYRRLIGNSAQSITQELDVSLVSILTSYANLLDLRNERSKAYCVRYYIAIHLVDELLQIEGGEVSYHSLVALFSGNQKATKLIENHAINRPMKNKLIQMFSNYLANKRIDNLIFWREMGGFSSVKLPAWQELSIAIKRNDMKMMAEIIKQSESGNNTIPESDKNIAQQKLGQYQKAWQHGQKKIGTMFDRSAESQLRKIHVTQNPMKVEGIGTHFESFTLWDVTRHSIRYFKPMDSAFLVLKVSSQKALSPMGLLKMPLIEDEKRLTMHYRDKQTRGGWSLQLDFADGVGEQRIGLFGDYKFDIDRYWSTRIGLGINEATEASQLLLFAGKENHLLFDLGLKPSKREFFGIQINLREFSDRFSEDIAKGWDMTIRASEKIYFSDPGWEIYTAYSKQKYTLNDTSLARISNYFELTTPLLSSAFIEESFSRLSIGQKVSQGNPGQQGALTPSPRYWLDTSLGYNFAAEQIDFGLSSGFGWRILGNDELYFSLDWQSQNTNNEESFNLSLGYYYNF